MSGTVLLISDLHARFGVLDDQLRHAEEELRVLVDQVLVLGDFGFFADDMGAHFRRGGRRFARPVATIDGNHEDHAALVDLARAYADVVTHLPRGTVHRIGPWRSLCLGGAGYMDAWSTPPGCEVTPAQLERALAHDPAGVDIVCTHDCPDHIGVRAKPGFEHVGPPGIPGLDALAARYRPRHWFFGHHHRWFAAEVDGTRFLGLPQSWEGYALLDASGEVRRVDHAVALPARSWWQKWLGLG